MPWGFAIAGAATIAGSKIQSDAAKKGADKGIAAEQEARDQARSDLAPWRAQGEEANMSLDKLMAGDYSGFENSPDFLYASGQMQKAIERGAAARGSLYSGGTNVDLAREIGGLASQNLGSYRGFLQNQSTVGANAAAGQASATQGAGSRIGGYANAEANAQGDIWGNAVNQFGQIGSNLYGRNQGLGSGWGGAAPAGGAGTMGGFGSEIGGFSAGNEWSSGTANPFRGGY